MEAQTQSRTTYAIDPSHSTVEFIARHMMITKVRGRFGAVQGTIVVPDGSDRPSEVDVTIDAKSIDTREEQRDAHLRSADFFDTENTPVIAFKSSHIEGTADDFKITGELSMHGVTREVTLNAEFEGRGTDPWGNSKAGYSAWGKVNRKDFGLNWNAALETGGVLVSDEIKIEINVQASLAK